MGGGEFTLSAIYRLKYPDSGYERGVKWYQNTSSHLWSTAKQFSGQKNFLGPTPGVRKVGQLEKWSISKFGIFDFGLKLGP